MVNSKQIWIKIRLFVLRFDMYDESSGMVLHCCDNLCEYNLIRSFNSCGSKLCESMAATSMILLLTHTEKKPMRLIAITIDAHRCEHFHTNVTYVAKSWTIRLSAFNSFFCGSVFWFSRRKSPLLAITVGLLLTGFGSKCVRSFGSEPCTIVKRPAKKRTTTKSMAVKFPSQRIINKNRTRHEHLIGIGPVYIAPRVNLLDKIIFHQSVFCNNGDRRTTKITHLMNGILFAIETIGQTIHYLSN